MDTSMWFMRRPPKLPESLPSHSALCPRQSRRVRVKAILPDLESEHGPTVDG